MAKGFNGKPKTKQLAFDLCLMYIEIEKQDIVQVSQYIVAEELRMSSKIYRMSLKVCWRI